MQRIVVFMALVVLAFWLFLPEKKAHLLGYVDNCSRDFVKTTPRVGSGMNCQHTLDQHAFSTLFYDSQGKLLRINLTSDDKFRVYTPLNKLPKSLINATLLKEDRFFWYHPGVNPLSLFKAALRTFVLKNHRMGASTLTMQLVRLIDHSPTKTIPQKIRQIWRAVQLERLYTKGAILEAYLNLAPYGHNIEGAAAASLIYFHKPITSISLPEAFSLSIIPQNPNQRLNANSLFLAARNRLYQKWVNSVAKEPVESSLFSLPFSMHTLKDLPFKAPHFIHQLEEEAIFNQPSVKTSLDLRLQETFQRIFKQYLSRYRPFGITNGAILLVDCRNMQVKSLIGSGDYFNKTLSGQINGTHVKRSPGSALKPFIYALALDEGLIHPNSILKDVPRYFGAYNPENFDYDFMGPVKAKDALILSRNIPAINLEASLTHPDFHEFLSKAHISQLKPKSYYGLSLALGGAEVTMQELVTLYAMLINKGIWHHLNFTQESALDKGEALLSEESSFIILDILKDTSRPLSTPRTLESIPIAWKTGTSSGFRDAWTVGTYGPYVLAVWIGNFNNEGNPILVGRSLVAPLFFQLLEGLRQRTGLIPETPKPPKGVQKIAICSPSGFLPTPLCPSTELAWFIPGKSPIKKDTVFRELAIDPKTGLRTCHIDANTRFEVFEFWPSDILSIFEKAGFKRKLPPKAAKECHFRSLNAKNPQITSPQSELIYVINSKKAQQTIPFSAIVDPDVSTLYWFVNGRYVGASTPEVPFWWTPQPGHFVVRAVDNYGLADSKWLKVSSSE